MSHKQAATLGHSAYRYDERGPLIPAWLGPNSPLHLNRTIRQRIKKKFDRNGIFLNIPYGKEYVKFELAIISTVTAYDLVPRMARDRSRFETRLLKIVELICTCSYSLTDLSYNSRMNMPLELGLLLALDKEVFIVSNKPYGSMRYISDLNFGDVHYHNRSVRRLVVSLSRWLEQNCSAKRITTKTLIQRYGRLRTIRKGLGEDFDRFAPEEITKFLGVAKSEFGMRLS